MKKYLILVAKFLEVSALIFVAAVFVIDKDSLEYFDSRNLDTQEKNRLELIWLSLKEIAPEARHDFIVANDDNFLTLGKPIKEPRIEAIRSKRNVYTFTAALLFALAKILEMLHFILSDKASAPNKSRQQDVELHPVRTDTST